jgi:4-hydroxybenzoyl-CoA thioesterase
MIRHDAIRPNRYLVRKLVRFSHCDPGRIVYYPRYFDILHEAMEDWFAEALELPFHRFIGEMQRGFPIVKLEATFTAPSRLGELLDVALSVGRLGNASLGLDYTVQREDELRLEVRTVVVQTRLATGSAEPIEGELRRRIEAFVAGDGCGLSDRGAGR